MKFNRVPEDQWPSFRLDRPIDVYLSTDFLVQVFAPANGGQRLTVCSTDFDMQTGRWRDGITWDQLQDIKNAVGFDNRWAIELFPPRPDTVNVANMRHLWLIDGPPAFAWSRTPPAASHPCP